jgi:hypothetical protein
MLADVFALVPPGVVAVMLTIPVPGGITSMVIDVVLFTVKHGLVGDVPQGVVVIAVVPTVTWVVKGWPAASKSVPVRATVLPPAGGPAFCDTPVMVGSGAT